MKTLFLALILFSSLFFPVITKAAFPANQECTNSAQTNYNYFPYKVTITAGGKTANTCWYWDSQAKVWKPGPGSPLAGQTTTTDALISAIVKQYSVSQAETSQKVSEAKAGRYAARPTTSTPSGASEEAPTHDLADYFDPRTPEVSGFVLQAWRFSRALANAFLIFILLILAYTQILHIQADTLGLKKILPTLILAIILANFSLVIVRLIIDLSNSLVLTFLGNTSKRELAEGLVHALGLGPLITGAFATAGTLTLLSFIPGIGGVAATGALIAWILFIVLMLIPAILMFILTVLLWIRIAVVLVLGSISPLAFIAMAFPPTQNLFRRWWSEFAKWVFMAPIVMFILWFVTLTARGLGEYKLLQFIIAIGGLIIAIQVPFKLGGAVMAAWGGFGKKIGRTAGLWALKTTDSKIGNFTRAMGMKRWSPYGQYVGWVAGSQRHWQEHVAFAGGRGEDIREAITSSKLRFRNLRDELARSPRYQQAQMQQDEEEANKMAATMNEDQIEQALNQAGQIGNPEERERQTRRLTIARAVQQGQVSSRDIERVIQADRLGGQTGGQEITSETNTLLNRLISMSRQQGVQLAQEFRQAGNRFMRRDPDAVQAEAVDKIGLSIEGKRPHEQIRDIQNVMKMLYEGGDLQQGRLLEYHELTGNGRALVDFLARFNGTPQFQQNIAGTALGQRVNQVLSNQIYGQYLQRPTFTTPTGVDAAAFNRLTQGQINLDVRPITEADATVRIHLAENAGAVRNSIRDQKLNLAQNVITDSGLRDAIRNRISSLETNQVFNQGAAQQILRSLNLQNNSAAQSQINDLLSRLTTHSNLWRKVSSLENQYQENQEIRRRITGGP